ncbi:hypothetical protein, no similarity [Maudiozyma saulgeensis]|uniref:Uncharacterized protein n=1 Tax=Maudiozyma saulgeensis TaxID=1789683 RepID=A0A1X7R780_9SACH|nr:hypothetical protein, no similarity [Kazachstania saulgeensis]
MSNLLNKVQEKLPGHHKKEEEEENNPSSQNRGNQQRNQGFNTADDSQVPSGMRGNDFTTSQQEEGYGNTGRKNNMSQQDWNTNQEAQFGSNQLESGTYGTSGGQRTSGMGMGSNTMNDEEDDDQYGGDRQQRTTRSSGRRQQNMGNMDNEGDW